MKSLRFPLHALLVAAIPIAAQACGGSARPPTPAMSSGPESANPDPGGSEPSAMRPATEPPSPDEPAGPSGVQPVAPGPGRTSASEIDAPPPGSAPTGDAESVVAAHNRHRAEHCAPPLVWSEEVAAVARAWANRLRDADCAFEHSRSKTYGENLFFMGPAGTATAADAVEDWYSEVARYDFANPGCGMSTGHFTQVVWRGTTQVGCGTARCPSGDIWVCNYYPPGNVLGQFPQNVLPTSCK